MNIIISLLITFLCLVSCEYSASEMTANPATNIDCEEHLSNSDTSDSNKQYMPNKNPKILQQFLANPLGIPSFDKNCGANRRSYQNESYLYKPSAKGVYQHYFVFTECGCKPYELQVVIYQYKSTQSETLIKIYGTCQTDQLKDFALVGKSWKTIEKKYGSNYLKIGPYRAYADHGNLLILKLENNGKIYSFQYVRTNKQKIQSVNDIPDDLLQ